MRRQLGITRNDGKFGPSAGTTRWGIIHRDMFVKWNDLQNRSDRCKTADAQRRKRSEADVKAKCSQLLISVKLLVISTIWRAHNFEYRLVMMRPGNWSGFWPNNAENRKNQFYFVLHWADIIWPRIWHLQARYGAIPNAEFESPDDQAMGSL
jgi:hypothetical protein